MISGQLPPLLVEISDGRVKWQQLEDLDHEMLGLFLSCHLIIEHYLDELLKIEYPALDWDASRQTFTQKTTLLSTFIVTEKLDFIPAVKHMNSLRNKLSHNVEFQIVEDSLLPLKYCLEKAFEGRHPVPSLPKEILKDFTSLVCSFLSGWISCRAHYGKITRK